MAVIPNVYFLVKLLGIECLLKMCLEDYKTTKNEAYICSEVTC